MRRFKGFTLTELMVALAVIGILVAVVTPAIMKNRPNKNKMMVKKSFYTVEQLVNSLVNDESLYPDMTNFCGKNPDVAGDEATQYCAFGFDYIAPAVSNGLTYKDKYKFPMLFKSMLNVKSDSANASDKLTDAPDPMNPSSTTDFYPVFYTTDGIKWDLSGTIADGSDDHWKQINKANVESASIGTFDSQNENTSGIGVISIDVNGDEGPNAVCDDAHEDCDQYEVQILANGKLRINPDHTRAVDYATINTSIKD